ncbi:MAG: sensor histidine kinase, partial [Acutalibacteraceae bacterium]
MFVDHVFLINITIESGGIALCIIAFLTILLSVKADKKISGYIACMNVVLAAALISNILGLIYKGRSEPVLFEIVRISNFCEFFFSYGLTFVFGRYLLYRVDKDRHEKAERLCIDACFATEIILLVISQFKNIYYYYDENFIYQRGEYFWISHALCIVSMIIDAVILFKGRKKLSRREKAACVCYIVIPMLAIVLQIFIYGLFFDLYSAIISVMIMLICVIMDQIEKYNEKERENTRMQIDIMLSQIQPHFLYNSISAICELCKADPMKAREALQNFSLYLRGNMDSLSSPGLIPFSDELRHIEAYLELEKMRFGDKLEVVYDIREKDFSLPVLTVQPLVENAVKHGICKKEDGGKLILRTQKEEDTIVISIIDSGAGFDSNSVNSPERTH